MNVVVTPQHPKQTDGGIVNPLSSATKTMNKISGSKGTQGFGSVFSQITTLVKVPETTGNKTNDSMKSLGETISVLGANSLEGLMNIMQLDTEGLDLSGSLTIEKIAELLQLDTNELKTTIEELLGKDLNSDDLWEMLGQIDQQVPDFLNAVMDSLAGVGNVTPQQAAEVMQLLKGIELTAPKTDLYLKQELAIFTLKDMLTNVISQIDKLTASKQSNTSFNLNKAWQTIVVSEQTVVKEETLNTLKTVSTQNVTKTAETISQISGTTLNQVKTETVTITLPVQRASQSEALIKELQTLLNRSQFGKTGGMTKMLIKMYPENLGTIRVELIQKDGMMTARLLANTALGKEMLDSQLHQLKSAFANANVQVDRLDVTQALQDANKNDKQQQFNQSFKQQQQNNNDEPNEHEETPEQVSFRDFLMELEA